MSKNVRIEGMVDKAEMAEHLAVVRQRIESEGLSRLELKARYRELVLEADDLEDAELKQMAMQESSLVREMLDETALPQPTPQEMVQELKESNPQAAEAIAHQLGIEARRKTVVDAEAALTQANENGFAPESEGYRRVLAGLEAAQESLDNALSELPPAFARDAEAKAHEATGLQQRAAADAMANSPDGTVQNAQADMYKQSDDNMAKATTIRTTTPHFEESTGGAAA